MNKILRFFPAIRVHSWGGFGSQLFTAYVVLKLQRKFPNRRIKVVIHTSGVSRRISEFDFETLGVKMVQVEDYEGEEVRDSLHEAHPTHSCRINILIKEILPRALKWLRLVQNANTDLSFSLISLWTFSLRGHYTRLTLEESIVEALHHAVFLNKSKSIMEINDLVVHYRLGDLLSLDEKQPIDVHRVEDVLKTLKVNSKHSVVLSDSKDEDLAEFLKTSEILKFCKPSNYDPNMTLRICIEAEKFVGTGSKISLWAAVFRYFVHKKFSSLPVELIWASKSGLKANWY